MAEELPNRLRYWRKAKGWSLEKLAEKVGSTNQTVSRYERGETQLTIPLLQQFATALDCTPADLLPNPELSMSPEEMRLLGLIRELTPEDKTLAERLLLSFGKTAASEEVVRLRRRPA